MNRHEAPQRRCALCIGFVAGTLALWPGVGVACQRPIGAVHPVLSLRFDNDRLGTRGQDSGYTSGLKLTLMSTNLNAVEDPDCLPPVARGIDRYLRWLQPEGFDQTNVVYELGQALFTPTDREATALLVHDRPYAATVLLSVGFNARAGDVLRTSHLRVGMVGPSARGEQIQNGLHELIGSKRFEGWAHQLRDEPLVQLVHERLHRWESRPLDAGWRWDMIGHAGAALGNLATYANIGAEWRFGLRLPDDFGSDPLRPAGQNTAPVRAGADDTGWAWHVFVSLDARAVAHDITLDGNMWKASHHVNRRPFVADFGRGVTVSRGRWKFALASYIRTREFDGQAEPPNFGSFTASYRF